jgi:hypothetical protein
MAFAPLVKIQAATAEEVCARFDLKKESRQLLKDGMSPQEFVAVLIENKKLIDAIDFMAHALPVREALWWGCLCMQHALDGKFSDKERVAATAAVQWIMQPSEENRAAAKAPADLAGPGSPAGALAMAAAQTGGSMAPPNAPPIPPPPFAPAKSIAMAVKSASTKSEPIKISPTQRSYVELALQIAEGRFI